LIADFIGDLDFLNPFYFLVGLTQTIIDYEIRVLII